MFDIDYEVHTGNEAAVYIFDTSIVSSSETTVTCPNILLDIVDKNYGPIDPNAFSFDVSGYPQYLFIIDTSDSTYVLDWEFKFLAYYDGYSADGDEEDFKVFML